MWSISSEDIERAKERLHQRRSEIEARHAEELKALETDGEEIAAIERAAAAFAAKELVPKKAAEDAAPKEVAARKAPEETAADPAAAGEPPAEAAAGSGDNKPGSRWRLHLGNRPAEAEGAVSAPAPR